MDVFRGNYGAGCDLVSYVGYCAEDVLPRRKWPKTSEVGEGDIPGRDRSSAVCHALLSTPETRVWCRMCAEFGDTLYSK
jgi:hypothetical protein